MKNALHFIFGMAFTIPFAQAQFTFTDLGALPGSGPTPAVIAYGINSAGDVCGSSSFIAPVTHIDPIHAFLWKPAKPNGTAGGMIDLGVVPHPSGENWSICTAVSTFAPVGYGYYPPEMSYRALVFGGEKFPLTHIPLVLPIPQPPPDFTPNSDAKAVNDSGVIVGSWTPSAGIYHSRRPEAPKPFTSYCR